MNRCRRKYGIWETKKGCTASNFLWWGIFESQFERHTYLEDLHVNRKHC